MALCKDQGVKYLNKLGYNVIRMPRAGIRPLTLIGKQKGAVAELGDLKYLVEEPGGPRPPIHRDLPSAAINGNRTSKLSLGLGINILGATIAAFGGGTLGLKAQYKNARKIEFEFKDCVHDKADPAAIGKYLSNADFDEANPVINQYVLGNGDLYVITQVLRSNAISVIGSKSDNTEVSVDVPAIKEIVGGDVKVEMESSSETKVTYSGPSRLAFGFQCLRLGIVDGELAPVNVNANGSIFLALSSSGGVEEEGYSLLTTNGLLDF